MNKVLEKYLQEAIEFLKNTADTVKGQIPLFMKEIIKYGVVSNIVSITWYIIIIGIIKYIGLFIPSQYIGLIIAYNISGVVAAFGLLIVIYMNVQKLLQIIIAPRIFLLKKITGILNEDEEW